MTDEVRDEEVRGPEPERPATERAEELVDRMAWGAGQLVSFVGLRLLKGASLAIEEAEDIWAEAQSLRRREGQDAELEMAEPEAGGGDASRTVEATEAARRKAEEMGVDLTEVRGTGADGRITVEDVKNRAKAESS